MSEFWQSEMFVRYSQGNKSVDIPWDFEVPYLKAWAMAHQNEDGTPPEPSQCDSATVWAHAMKIREAEDHLREMKSE